MDRQLEYNPGEDCFLSIRDLREDHYVLAVSPTPKEML